MKKRGEMALREVSGRKPVYKNLIEEAIEEQFNRMD
jgi:hypothetical protein